MFDSISYQKEKKLLSIVDTKYSAAWNEHHIFCRPQEVIDWIRVIREDLSYLYFIDAVVQEYPSNTHFDFELDIIVANLESHQRLHLHIQFNRSEVIPSIIDFYPAALFALREQRDLFDFKFSKPLEALWVTENNKNLLSDEWNLKKENQKFLAPKLPFNPNKTEAPYPQEKWRWKHCDLYSKETLGKFEAFYCFDPFKLVDVRIRLGSHFRGIESLLTQKSHAHITHLLENVNEFASPFYSGAWAINLEKILGIDITERAKALRIVLWELSRMSEHLFVIYESCSLLKLNEAQFFLDAYERTCELFERLTGNRHGKGMMCIGGVRMDIPAGWLIEFQDYNKVFLKNLQVYHQHLLSNAKFRTLLTHAKVSSHAVLQYGVSGPSLRAAGINYDLRKSRPLYFYEDIDFDVPVGVHGTSYDRFLIRFEEIIQSSRIITQVLDNLPMGNIDLGLNETEWMNSLRSKRSEYHYFSLEAPNGETGVVYAQGENASIKRLKIKSPSLFLAQGLGEFLRGTSDESIAVALASLGIREREMER